eukprot:TRINITY_DN968_c0_g1_i3.p1 TRINITY_DN968_c0_g1~~TRINITY_DN968_c0_g1_i3.p1  ORF type:complete len:302 (+),score=32.89 TRINITY_DN968_c0_g1_i3:84-908(+)
MESTHTVSIWSNETWKKQKKILEAVSNKSFHIMDDLVNSIKELASLAFYRKEGAFSFPLFKHFSFLSTDKQNYYIFTLFPFIASLALKLETYFPEAFPLLPTGKQQAISLPRDHVASIIAGCFYCTLTKVHEGKALLDSSFLGIYCSGNKTAFEKLKFYLCYFETILKEPPKGDLVVTRISLTKEKYEALDETFWMESSELLREVYFKEKGKIEDSPEAIQVDFADSYVGGGVDDSADQEQILFLIYPELHIAYPITLIVFLQKLPFIQSTKDM